MNLTALKLKPDKISHALRDRARFQCMLATWEASMYWPFFTRIRMYRTKLYVVVAGQEYDIDKVRTLPKFIGIWNKIHEIL